MSINKLISIRIPIIDAMERLSIDHDKLIPLFTRWATLAEKEIGSKFQYVTKREVLTIENCAACLPNNAVHIELAIMGDYGCECGDLMGRAYSWASGRVTTETPTFLVVDVASDGTTFNGCVNYTIQNNKLIFNQDYNGQSITIQYLAIETDCDGFTLIGQNHVLALTEYIIWRYYGRKQNMNYIERDKMREAKDEWNRECAHARATDGQISDQDRYEIVHGIIHNPYIGISLSAGMRTTLDNTWDSWNG